MMDEIRELLNQCDRYKSRFMYSPTPQFRSTKRDTKTILPHLRPFTCISHPLAQPFHKKQEDRNERAPQGHHNNPSPPPTSKAGNIDTTLLTCLHPQLDALKSCSGQRYAPSPVLETELLDHLHSCEKEAMRALARADRELFSTTYRQDFKKKRGSVDTSTTRGAENTPSPSKPKHYFTSTSDHYRPPPKIPSLNLSNTRFGYNHLYVKASNGGVPGRDSDMYRNPEYITPQYKLDYTNPYSRK